MKKCTQIDRVGSISENSIKADKPLVSILLAVYNPNEKWFIEQLISLNEQTYENLNLFVYDDCPDYPFNEQLLKKYITKFKYIVLKGEVNRGSNKAFEELTKVADGEYFAYCDQDDIWEKNKISLLIEKFKDDNVTLVCCDLSIIDKDGFKTNESITEIRKRIKYRSGYNLAKDILITNFVTGCAMIVKKEIALKSVPFINEIIHDQWIAIIAAMNGKIEFVDKSLVRYRQHGGNQTGILMGIYNKKTYYLKRVDDFIQRYISLKYRLSYDKDMEKCIDDTLEWLKARKEYSIKPSINSLKIILKYRNFHKISVLIEVLLPIIPESFFKKIIEMTRKGLL